MTTRTTLPSEEPAASRIACMFSHTWRVSAAMPPVTSVPVAGSVPSWPETKIHPPAAMAWERGTRAGGTLSVWTTRLSMAGEHGSTLSKGRTAPGRRRVRITHPSREEIAVMPNVRMLRDDEIQDPQLRELIRQATERGAPDPNFFRIMGHVPELARKTYEVWHEAFNRGALDHRLKELIRIKMSRHVSCTY